VAATGTTRSLGSTRMLATAAALASCLLIADAASGSTAAPSIKLLPAVGPPTAMFKVAGRTFGPAEQVDITFDAAPVGTATTDGSGAFLAQIQVPQSALPGGHTVTATGETSLLQASKGFLVRTDWPKFHFGLDNVGFNPFENVLSSSSVSGLTLKWSYLTGGTVGTPTVVGGVVYVGSSNHNIYALDATTGVLRWSYATGGTVSSAHVVNGVVYVGSSFPDNHLYALDAKTGSFKWSFDAGGSVGSPAVGTASCTSQAAAPCTRWTPLPAP
jgi:outer membrane protein assembly factor BamB